MKRLLLITATLLLEYILPCAFLNATIEEQPIKNYFIM